MDTSLDHKQGRRLIARAVLWTARFSAGLSCEQLAERLGVDETTVLSWEKGTVPLASLQVPELNGLKEALLAAGAHPELVADLETACWCDVVIEAIVQHEDITCLLADPLACNPAFKDLLAWAVAGVVPLRYIDLTPNARH